MSESGEQLEGGDTVPSRMDDLDYGRKGKRDGEESSDTSDENEEDTDAPQPPSPDDYTSYPCDELHEGAPPKTCGRYVYVGLEGKDIPAMVTNSEMYIPVVTAQEKLMKTVFVKVHADLYVECKVKSFRMKLKENSADSLFPSGSAAAAPTDQNEEVVVRYKDLKEFFRLIYTIYGKVYKKTSMPIDRCGFLMLQKDATVPYVVIGGVKYLPIIYFEGDLQPLYEQSITIRGWDLAYLKFCFIVHGIDINRYDVGDECKVTPFHVVRKYFPSTTRYPVVFPPRKNTLHRYLGSKIGTSSWFVAPQDLINTEAENFLEYRMEPSQPLNVMVLHTLVSTPPKNVQHQDAREDGHDLVPVSLQQQQQEHEQQQQEQQQQEQLQQQQQELQQQQQQQQSQEGQLQQGHEQHQGQQQQKKQQKKQKQEQERQHQRELRQQRRRRRQQQRLCRHPMQLRSHNSASSASSNFIRQQEHVPRIASPQNLTPRWSLDHYPQFSEREEGTAQSRQRRSSTESDTSSENDEQETIQQFGSMVRGGVYPDYTRPQSDQSEDEVPYSPQSPHEIPDDSDDMREDAGQNAEPATQDQGSRETVLIAPINPVPRVTINSSRESTEQPRNAVRVATANPIPRVSSIQPAVTVQQPRTTASGIPVNSVPGPRLSENAGVNTTQWSHGAVPNIRNCPNSAPRPHLNQNVGLQMISQQPGGLVSAVFSNPIPHPTVTQNVGGLPIIPPQPPHPMPAVAPNYIPHAHMNQNVGLPMGALFPPNPIPILRPVVPSNGGMLQQIRVVPDNVLGLPNANGPVQPVQYHLAPAPPPPGNNNITLHHMYPPDVMHLNRAMPPPFIRSPAPNYAPPLGQPLPSRHPVPGTPAGGTMLQSSEISSSSHPDEPGSDDDEVYYPFP